jgi:hypothetical protein
MAVKRKGKPSVGKAVKKVYTKTWVAIAAFIGGPLAACYLLSENFETFGRKKLADQTIVAGVAFSLVLFAVTTMLPDWVSDYGVGYGISIGYVVAFYHLAKEYQEKDVEDVLEKGGEQHSVPRVLLISLASLAITVLYILAVVLVAF